MENKHEWIRQIALFQDLSNEDLSVIASAIRTKHVQKGTHIFYQHEQQAAVYFIKEGQVKIYRDDINGKEQIVSLLHEGDMFPHVGFFHKIHYPANSIAIVPTTLMYIHLLDFENVLMQHPNIAIKLYGIMSKEILDLQDRLEEQMLSNVYIQVINLFLRLGRSHGKWVDDKYMLVSIPLSIRDLASMIGTTRETISRTIHQLKEKNIVIPQTKGKYLIDVFQLEKEKGQIE
ncbi:Crp/Fnr family transcriptional regulator [Bacillus ginsengihumi]|uniref:Crp/Fnr family transcriptional regulator n=1 Tax=Heyndrickxia ginsengihumi TaxID=363870 RepID=A0A0A6VCQ1_9BACI|nr:Crp/Fnr family transcriptional regulator [Heyndrickxia ginsengihumi]KHD85346.1 Crp/Fnr family transcriptional regulator [Heyndrickxia ginsengihumi]MBE6184248.1 Crp/Fnr family transcriptional regulator [Bacillus sp. (in: firmicutes)]MCM3024379.1 Crp/Fnr family transcriptional regulator [Heyndrickxia ginsengihumi]NEY21509.1 Crp/Fnr family transcriptional regulator [Heyndrickxia ginsengihumi]